MLRERTDTQAARRPGLIPLTVREIKRLLAATLSYPKPPGYGGTWSPNAPTGAAVADS